MEVSDTLGFLLGTWSIERSVVDHRQHCLSSFSGTAKVWKYRDGDPDSVSVASASPDSLSEYRESGVMHIGDYSSSATRRLLLEDQGDGSLLLRFLDGHLFIPLDLRQGQSEASHQCRADTYLLQTAVVSDSEMTETWKVQGPEKDYLATTRLLRVDGSSCRD